MPEKGGDQMMKEKETQISQRHIPLILRDLLRNWLLILLSGLIGFMGVFIYAGLFHTPMYTSTVTFAVSPKSNGSYVGFYTSLHTANEMAGVFKEVFSSDVLKRMVQEKMENPNLVVDITAEVEEATNILRLSVTGDDPIGTHQTMNAVLSCYDEVSDYLFGGVVLDTIKSPKVPTTPSNPMNMTLWYGVISILAMCLMAGIITWFSLNRKTIKTLTGARQYMGQAPLGVLIHEKHKQKNLMISQTSVSFRFVEGMLQVAHKLRHRMVKERKKTLLITSVAENEGKTTLSANLALAMAKHGNKVALVDLDLRRPSQHKLFAEAKPCSNPTQAMSKWTVLRPQDNLYVFSMPDGVQNAGNFLHDASFEDFIRELSETMDFVIFDSAPFTAVADSGMLLKYADGCILCIRQDWVPGDVLQAVAKEMDESSAEYMGYVLNAYLDDGTLQSSRKKNEQYKYYGRG